MNNERALTYAGRHVHSLIQSLPGSNQLLPGNTPRWKTKHTFDKNFNCITLILTESEITELLSAVLIGAHICYPDDSHRVAWLLWQFLEFPVACDIETIEKIVYRYIEDIENNQEDEEDMPVLEIVTIDGKSYLQQNCGCDDTRFYELSSVSIANGSPVSSADSPAQSTFDTVTLSANNEGCYATKATNYLLNRAYDYFSALNGFVGSGLDALTPIDEFIDVAFLTKELVSGNNQDVDTLREVTDQNMYSALFDAGNVAALESAWTFTGKVSRDNLRSWVANSKFLVGVVPVRLLLQYWVNQSLIPFYNQALETLALECETSSSFSDFDTTYNILASNSLYQLQQFVIPTNTLASVGDVLEIANIPDLLAIGYKVTLVGGTSFGNSLTMIVRSETIEIDGKSIGGNTDNIGIQYVYSRGDAGAVGYIANNLPDYVSTSAGVFSNPTVASGMLDFYIAIQPADWVIRIDELYIVVPA